MPDVNFHVGRHNNQPFLVFMCLVRVKTIKVGAVPAKKTADCFTKEKRYIGDVDLGHCLPGDQEAEAEGEFVVSKLKKPSSLKQLLDFQIGRETADFAELSAELKARCYITTLSRTENLIDEQEVGIDVGLLPNLAANFFLVLDKEENVCVVDVFCYNGRWGVSLLRLDYDVEWSVGDQLFLRN